MTVPFIEISIRVDGEHLVDYVFEQVTPVEVRQLQAIALALSFTYEDYDELIASLLGEKLNDP